ncbi:MAG: cytochrome c maturation protein CcmE [Chloroflexi bacterium]|nr:cytochrome c maturation protein CcmE [Chloroflexota bacterium]
MNVQTAAAVKSPIKWKFVVGGSLIVAAIIYLIVSSTKANAQYFLTVEELQQRQAELLGKNVRISGVVIGDTIQYDAENLVLRFTVANIPGDQDEVDQMGGMAVVLHNAAQDESLPRLNIIYNNVKPDLLKNDAQAIMTGRLNSDGSFTADELLLKCPTKYEEAVPEQASGE